MDLFDARAPGHPLIKPEFRVCNDFEMGKHLKISMLTGSNMAGNSTVSPAADFICLFSSAVLVAVRISSCDFADRFHSSTKQDDQRSNTKYHETISSKNVKF